MKQHIHPMRSKRSSSESAPKFKPKTGQRVVKDARRLQREQQREELGHAHH